MLTEGDADGAFLMDLFTNAYKFYATAPGYLISRFKNLMQARKITKDGKHWLHFAVDVFIIKHSNCIESR